MLWNACSLGVFDVGENKLKPLFSQFILEIKTACYLYLIGNVSAIRTFLVPLL